MAETLFKLQARLMREYYKNFSKYSKGKACEEKIAWVTSFAPVEILEALGVSYYYPESYAAVIAASEKEQQGIDYSEQHHLSRDCCSYSCCFNGCLETEDAPRGIPPIPDVLIATNNQCNTLPNWWNLLAIKYNVPLIIIDYPGEAVGDEAFEYVKKQHDNLIEELERISGNNIDFEVLNTCIDNSLASVEAWKKVISYQKVKKIEPTDLFDDINFLITARCKKDTASMYEMLADKMSEKSDADDEGIPLFWLGYPLWYHKDRYLSEILQEFRIVGSNYVTWWNLDYSGNDVFEKLYNAYNFTFLNLKQSSRDRKLAKLIAESGALCTVTAHNKSCKCDFVSAQNVSVPQAEIEIDMIDRNYLDVERARSKVELLKDIVCMK